MKWEQFERAYHLSLKLSDDNNSPFFFLLYSFDTQLKLARLVCRDLI